ncbi:hypothetical protein J5N97_010782 [Dioscorea zingiberensis]|uniref:Bifunctional inhibitor/plant lipid transfer protein/seed storage helical domain-containing protein n=1 Tax=Dioscorea zingiberensis TaxID=325984 RepID=A0A9D5D1C0_9LILI|nr:hypothetical protein J5N97_010782 [Dioscorea zingiberensis]
MASSMKACMSLAMLALMLAHASAQSTSCTTAVVSLVPCLSYITGNSTTPSASCCSQLSNVVQTQVQCLCTVLNGGASQFGISINQTQALTLPGACKIQTPPISRCNAAGGGSPATSPAATPTAPSNDSPATDNNSPTATPTVPSDDSPATDNNSPATPSVPDVPSSGTGSKATPTTNGEASDGSSTKLNQALMLCVMIVAACVSPFFTI